MDKSTYYPVFMNITGKKCLVIGGGRVGLRKVNGLLECGADVEVISSRLCTELEALAQAGKIKALRRDFRQGDLTGAFLVFAATSDQTASRAVSAEARRAGIPVNAADEAGVSDFILPARLRRGPIVIAVSTGGESPALSRKIAARLADIFGEEYVPLAGLIAGIRSELKKQGIKVDAEKWQKALDLDRLALLLKEGKNDEARTLLLNSLASGPENQ